MLNLKQNGFYSFSHKIELINSVLWKNYLSYNINVITCFFLVFLTFLPTFAHSQNNPKDIKQSIITSHLEHSEKKKKEGDYKEASRFMNDAAIYCWEYKDYDKAIHYFEESVKLNELIGNQQGIMGLKNNLGMIYSDLKKYDLAYINFVAVLEERKRQKEPTNIVKALMNLSVTCTNLKQYDKSINYLNEALELSLRTGDTEQMRSCYAMLAEAYEKKGDSQNMLKYFDMYKTFHEKVQINKIKEAEIAAESAKLRTKLLELESKMKDNILVQKDTIIAGQERELQGLTISQQKILKTMSKRTMLLEIAEKEVKIKALQLNKQKISNELEIVRQRNITNILLIALLFLLIIAFILWQKYNEKRKTNLLLATQKTLLIHQADELSTQAAALKETNKVKDKLFSLIAHDLRNPINSLKGVFFLVENGGLSLEELQYLMVKIKVEVLTVEEMMSNLLLWAKSQLMNIQTSLEEFEILTVIEENFKLLKKSAETKNIALNCRIEEDAIKIKADINQIRVIIRNLVTNAIKFTPEGGTITIEAQNIENYWKIAVHDTGMGMSDEEIGKLFNISTHFTKQGTSKEKGSGLGLLLCKEFVENHKGKIWVQSKENQGTTILFTLSK